MGTKTFNNYESLLTFTRASKGHALRPVSYGAELVTNGTFDSDASGWTEAGSGQGTITVSSNQVVVTATQTGSLAFQQASTEFEAGKMYQIKVDVVTTTDNISVWNKASSSIPISGLSTGTNVINYFATESGYFRIGNLGAVFSTGEGFTLDNISVKEVTFDQPDGTLTLFEHLDNIPRVEWDAQRNRLGLLVEESRTNLITHSQDFTNAAWTKTNTATLALDSVGPDGQANSAVNLVDSGATGTGVVLLFDTVTVETSSTYTASVYAKKNGLSDILLYHGNFTTPSDGGYYFNLEDGTITSGGSSGTATIEEVGNGWYRCAITFTTDAADTSGVIRMYVTDGTNITVDLDGTSSVLIYGAQLEKGSFPTSYIKNEGTSGGVTRSADVASIPVADFGFNTDAGTLLVDFDMKYEESGSLFPRVVEIATASSNADRIKIQVVENTGVLTAQSYTNFNIQANLNLGARTGGSLDATKVAFAFKENDFAASDNGDTALTDTTGTFAPSVGRDTLAIGKQSNASNNFLNGHIKSIKYYPRRLTNAQLQDITS